MAMRASSIHASRRGRACAALAALLVAGTPAGAHEAPAARVVAPEPALPVPGSYELPTIARVEDALVLDDGGAPAPLLDLAAGQVAVVSFVYTHCADGGGCPLALATLQRLDRAVAADPKLRERVRLVTVSFDPVRDTPPVMRGLRDRMRPAGDWRFRTARSADAIAPVLAAFGQDALPLVDEGSRATGVLRHLLKVFLVDATGGIRNIYGADFLSAELIAVDARTVLLESRRAEAGGAP
jgi:cytochrome oxidase Cu insertion factor (SCO1/SenC/PrrC family)